MSELRGCPVPCCGNEVGFERLYRPGVGFCFTCPSCRVYGPWADTPEEAIRLWNTRHAPDKSAEERAAYERGRADVYSDLYNEYRTRMTDSKGDPWMRGWNAAFLQMLSSFPERIRALKSKERENES